MKFAAVINCIDGRVQVPAIEFMRRRFGVDYVDVITEPGPIKLLSERTYLTVIDSIRKRVAISIERHQTRQVGLVAHHDCAANPQPREKQLIQLEAALKTARGWGLEAEIIGLWIDENWKAHEVDEKTRVA